MNRTGLKYFLIGLTILCIICFLCAALVAVITRTAPPAAISLWDKVDGYSWQSNAFAGGSYTFFEDERGNKLCIIQQYGSGLPLVSSRLVPVEIVEKNNREHLLIDGVLVRRSGSKLVSEQLVLSEPGPIFLIDKSGRRITLEQAIENAEV